ncbi:SAM-dependent methyltransferase [Nocardiopsis sp. L17-MgMaSL7]|uniref:SAM-dependent methyltransferase n=1 Tax=Nocardiopsis sp. L17-MgMaSL7 TaxID=1938893 RepID=UPI000D992DF8|nr:SAM-dependent methyltransferase [Nocardiopsis sp. L17-MgMaSL7]PWV57809.1 S-adenosyl methyltransferase [Nocardiopsis sp. L17-MgMaSL7]
MTDVRGPKTGPLTAVFRATEPPRVPEQPSPVVSLSARGCPPPDPAETELVRLHQAFLGRVVDYLCADAGIRQFVDWGCPVPGTAERIRRANTDATVVHLAPTGTAGVLAAPALNATVLAGDGAGDSGTDTVLRRLHTSGLVDFDEPVAVLMTRPGTEQEPPAGLDTLHTMMRGGGYVALTSTAPRPTAERAFAPFLPVEPGVADLTWWPYPDEDVPAPGCGTLGGLGRVPRRGRGATRWR